jgi:hypothetical protein
MKKTLLTVLSIFILFLGCEKEGLDGKNSLMDLIIEPTGDNCSSGGYKIISGTDLNNDGTLDENEIQNTEYICNGDDGNNGNNSLLNVISEPAGENCSSGGYKIINGLDLNGNDILDESEIQNTQYICNGDDGYIHSDNLVRLTIANNGIRTSSTDWYISEYPTYNFPDFNKNDYGNIDSIVFVPSLHSDNSNNKCIVELYNITDGISIENSQIESNSIGWDFYYSENIYNYLPSKTIDIGVRIKSENNGQYVSTGIISYLYIYRSQR